MSVLRSVRFNSTDAEQHIPSRTISHNGIQSATAFHQTFPDHRIVEPHDWIAPSTWNFSQERERIEEWLCEVCPQLIQNVSDVVRTSEASLYSLIICSLLPVFDLCNCSAQGKLVQDPFKGSHNASTATLVRKHSMRLRRSCHVDDTALPNFGNIASQSDVIDFVAHMNKLISTGLPRNGRVEILIKNETTGRVLAVIEAVPHHLSDSAPDNAGFYQCCAYMALFDVAFGIYTDHKAFQFIKIDSSKIIHHSPLIDLMKSDYLRLDQDAVFVYAYLFDILGISSSTDLLASAAAKKLSEEYALLPT